jgi:ubiquinone biosynthesis protein
LNVEGLGRQLDPDLDLWTTAQPFLEKWMKSQVGWPAFRDKLKNESTRYAQYLPEIPRLLHQALLAQEKRDDPVLRELLQEQRRTNALLQTLMAFVVGFIVAVLLLAAVDSHWLQLLF